MPETVDQSTSVANALKMIKKSRKANGDIDLEEVEQALGTVYLEGYVKAGEDAIQEMMKPHDQP